MKVFDTINNIVNATENDEHYTIIEEFPEIDYALIYRHTRFQPWVAAWGLNKEKEYWNQGHYFETGTDAIKYICSKYEEREVKAS